MTDRLLLSPAELHGVSGLSMSFIYRHWRELGGAKYGTARRAPIRFTVEGLLEYHRAHIPERPSGPRRIASDDGGTVAHIRRFAARRRQGRTS